MLLDTSKTFITRQMKFLCSIFFVLYRVLFQRCLKDEAKIRESVVLLFSPPLGDQASFEVTSYEHAQSLKPERAFVPTFRNCSKLQESQRE